MNNNVTIADIVKAVCGKDDENKPNSLTSIGTGYYDEENEDIKDLNSSVFENPIVKIENHSPIIQIDLIFPSAVDIELRRMWAILENYGAKTDAYECGQNPDSPVCLFSFAPKQFNGKYIINVNEPIMWVNQPQNVGSTQNNVIRCFAYEDAVTAAENTDINLKEMDLYARREAERQEELLYNAELSKIEEEEYQRQRNETLEEMRRNGKY